MKTSNLELDGSKAASQTRGHVGPRAGSTGPTLLDQFGTEVDSAPDIEFLGARVTEREDLPTLVTIDGSTATDIPIDEDGGPSDTLDFEDGAWRRITLTEDITLTVEGFVVDQGSVMVVELTQDGTGGWAVTWDPDVQFIGDDQPDTTAATTTVFLLFTSRGDTAIFGVKAGGGGGATGAAGGDLSGTYPNPSVTDDSHSHTAATLPAGVGGHYEVIVSGTAPPVAVTNPAEDDWLYGFVPD